MSIKTVNDIELYYEMHGQGEPLLLIHGLGSSSKDWEYQIDFFAKKYQVITLDVRGHGNTTKTDGEYSIELFAKDISDLMNILGFKNYHVVGLSMGGMIAFQLAIEHSEQIKSITVVNSGPGFSSTSLKLRIKFYFRLFLLNIFSMKAAAKRVGEGLFPKPEQHELFNLFVQRFCENDKTSYMKATKCLLKWNVVSKLDQIQCPILILTADNDYTSIESKKNYLKKIPHAQLKIIKDSHHALPVEKPEEFNQAVMGFLNEIETNTSQSKT